MTNEEWAHLLWVRRLKPSGSWRPIVYDASSEEHRENVAVILSQNPNTFVCDSLAGQLRDLAIAELKKKSVPKANIDAKIASLLGGNDPSQYGCWVHYPWLNRVVHTLPRRLFRRLRLDRNRHKITVEEQEGLRQRAIGIVGMSVGRSVLMNLVLEGVGGTFRLSDFDPLDLSNLNRLRSSVADLGTNKVLLAAREAFEIDPFLNVEIFPSGTTDDNLDELCRGLDLLVDECDDLCMKVRLRERAKALRIPVIMETSDRGMLDIERFDLEPSRPIFHGKLPPVDAEALRGLSNKERTPFALRVLDGGSLSTRMAASLAEVEETIYTWPQLGSAVSLGGAVACDTARRVLLGTLGCSGRYYVDLERLVGPLATVERAAAQPITPDIEPGAALPRVLPTVPEPRRGSPSLQELEFLVRHAVLAPSGGNNQPWRFEARRGELLCLLDESRARTFLDYDGRGHEMALGAAVENACLAAERLGLRAAVHEEFAKGGGLIASLRFERAAMRENPLRATIAGRVTNRRVMVGQHLDPVQKESLVEEAQALGVRLVLVENEAERRQLGEIVGEADRQRGLIEPYHRELFEELRWDPQEVLTTRTGIDIRSLELTAAEMAGIRLMQRWDVANYLAAHSLGGALRKTALDAFVGCAGVGLISAPTSWSHFDFGRALQRLWLRATSLNLAWQPWSAICGMLPRAQAGAGLSPAEARRVLTIGTALLGAWTMEAGFRPMFLVRVLNAPPPPSCRALRLDIRDVFGAEPE